jgi:hypothetical protein
MATTIEIYQRWLDYNTKGKGKESGGSGCHRYYRNVYYYNDVPQHRFYKREGKKAIIAVINALFYEKAHQNVAERVYVEDIAVFSKYPDDMLDDEKAHDRQRYMMLCAALHLVDVVVPGWSDEECAETKRIAFARGLLENRIEVYKRYSNAFDLHWPPLPASLESRMLTIIEMKADRWRDPKSVERRERQQARRLANKALGLD